MLPVVESTCRLNDRYSLDPSKMLWRGGGRGGRGEMRVQVGGVSWVSI